jgi:hypothetical protein
MGSMFVRVGLPLRRKLWHRLRGVMDIFHLLPPVAAVIIFQLLWKVGQIRELYLSYLEQKNPAHIVFAFAGFGMISFLLYGGHYHLSRIRENIIYSNYVRPNIGIDFRFIRRWAGLLWAALPWVGLVLGLWGAKQYLATAATALQDDAALPVTGADLLLAIGLVVFVGAGVLIFLHYSRHSRLLPWILGALVVALGLGAAFMPIDDIVWVYRWLGPFATLSIEIIFILAFFTLVAVLSQQSEFPALTLVVTAIAFGALFNIPLHWLTLGFGILCLPLIVSAMLARLWAVSLVATLLCAVSFITLHRDVTSGRHIDPNMAGPSKENPHPALPTRNVQGVFGQWFDARKDKPGPNATAKGTAYPVFIIAVEGGGIYAAAAASLFLARLQDDRPCFAEHVFALSGVSGGAIGATIFQALANPAASTAGDPAAACGQNASKADTLSQHVTDIMSDDYFSPVVGAILPDFLGERMGRAETLEASFVASVRRYSARAADSLNDWYLKHWSVGAAAPALVLNTTSAETGYRVALAPFGLNNSGNQELFSFSDSGLTNHGATPAEDVSLMFAAVASARFPVILPPYSISVKAGSRWNFVDGGYADNSGAETALDIYRSLMSIPDDPHQDWQIERSQPPAGGPQDGSPQSGQKQNSPKKVLDLKIILVTSDDPLADFNKINGTQFGDTVAPISAILNVRKGLGDQAVARVCDYFRQAADVDVHCNNQGRATWNLKLVKIEDQAFALPLAWKISDTTFRVVSRPLVGSVGGPSQCDKSAPSGRNVGNEKESNSANAKKDDLDALNNGCVIYAVEKALDDFHD